MKKKTIIGILASIVIAFGAGILLTRQLVKNTPLQNSDQRMESAETNLISDPVYGDNLTKEELESLKEEDSLQDNPDMVIGEEFTIELEENQETGSF